MQQSNFIANRPNVAAFALALITAAAPTHAQDIIHATAPLPTFEVATVKLVGPDTGSSAAIIAESAATDRMGPAADTTAGGEKIVRQATVSVSFGEAAPSDRVHLTFNARSLVAIAYGLPLRELNRVIGGPAWIDSDADRYEVNAKIDDADFASMRKDTHDHPEALMEQSLLADRFHLKVHFETRDLPVYTLVVAKGGPKMTPAKPGEPPHLLGTGDGQNNVLTAQAITVGQLVRSPLLRPEGRMVVDRTGLTAAYDFTLKSSIAGDPDSTGPSLFTAMEEQLGLKLIPTKAPLEVIVIDHIDRPDAN